MARSLPARLLPGVTLALYYPRMGTPVERVGWKEIGLLLLAGFFWLTVEHFPVAGENFARMVHPSKGWSAAIIFLLLLRISSCNAGSTVAPDHQRARFL